MEELLNEKKEKALSKKSTVALRLGSVLLVLLLDALIVILICKQKIGTSTALFLGFLVTFYFEPLHYILRKPIPKSREETGKKSLSKRTAFVIYSGFIALNIVLSFVFYPLSPENVIARDFLELTKPFVAYFICIFGALFFKKSGMKALSAELWGISLAIPPIIAFLIKTL